MMRVIFIALFFIAAAGCANADIAELGLEHLKGRLMRPSDSPAATPQLTSSLRKIAPGALTNREDYAIIYPSKSKFKERGTN